MKQIALGERTIVHVLNEALACHPEKTWLKGEFGARSYADIATLSDRIATGLLRAGLTAGDRVLVMMRDTPEMIAVWIACAKTGIIDVPLNVAYRGAPLIHVANDCGAKVAIIDIEFATTFDTVSVDLAAIASYFVLESEAKAEPLRTLGGRPARPFDDLIQDAHFVAATPAESDIMSIMYTSGTSGGAKGVLVTHAHGFEYANAIGSVLEIDESDVFYSAGLPLFHVAGRWGVIFGSALFGATCVMPRQFSARAFWTDVRENEVTVTYLLGAMANFLQRQPLDPRDANNPLQKVLMCPLLSDCADFATRFDLKIASAYGSTETGCPIVMPLGTTFRDKQIVGKARAGKYDAMVVDENDLPVAPGTVGELLLRPREPWITMRGYWNQPEKTLQMWRNLWLHTGDAGRIDEDGYVYFIDRIQDTIRRRGENISSMEVESIISRHPSISECAVFPVPSEHTEYDVMISIVLKQGESADPVGIIRFAEKEMSYFMVPRYIDFVAALPKTQTGKVQKNVLRTTGVSASTWDREAAGIKLTR
ncbi:AMP-binding protein [Ensifer sp. NBAIM29]|nr:AMP-binding protein [Ensifer sp. NBAIM29]